MTPLTCSAEVWRNLPGTFVALWTHAGHAYALFDTGLYTTALVDGAYPTLSLLHPGADWFERLARDLNRHTASGASSTRTAIEHFRAADASGPWPDFEVPSGEGVAQIALGPIHGGITEPAYFRFSVHGEKVLKLQTRLGYSHKATLSMMRGKSPRLAARFAARVCGDATVAHSIAFARAAEAALGIAVPSRAIYLRAIMAEIERIANHAGDLGAIAAEAGLSILDARLGWHRESFCTAACAAFGHRLMIDNVIPGGVAADIHTGGADQIMQALNALDRELPRLAKIFEQDAGLQDRLVGTGVISGTLAKQYGAGGFVGRASGSRTDARSSPGYPPYDTLPVAVPAEADGDVAARIRVRMAEMIESVRLIRECLTHLPDGQIAVAPSNGSGMGCAVAESFRGPVWHWLVLEAGQIVDIFISDASTLHWPLLEYAAENSIVADFPLIVKSINASHSGLDL